MEYFKELARLQAVSDYWSRVFSRSEKNAEHAENDIREQLIRFNQIDTGTTFTALTIREIEKHFGVER